MDEELSQLEVELRNLRPAPPSPALRARLQRDLGPATARRERPAAGTGPRARPHWWWLAALPAAATVAVVFTLKLRTPPATGPSRALRSPPVARAAPAGDTFKPVTAQNVLYAADDEGMVTLDDGTPARRERLHFVDTITWRNPRTNASLKWSVPREEVRIVPVNFQ